MNANTTSSQHLPGKLIAGVLVVGLIALGIVGLVLPLVPGLVFLAIAAVIVARYFPSIDDWLRNNRAFGRHMEWADAFYALPLGEKVQLGAWVGLKVLLDSLALVGSTIMKILSPLTNRDSRSHESH